MDWNAILCGDDGGGEGGGEDGSEDNIGGEAAAAIHAEALGTTRGSCITGFNGQALDQVDLAFIATALFVLLACLVLVPVIYAEAGRVQVALG